MSQLINIISWLSCWVNWFFMVVAARLPSFIYITIIFDSFSWLICCLCFFRVDWCLYFRILHKFNKFVRFQLLILIDTRLGSRLVNVTSNTILLGNTYCILYGPNHFLMNFPICDSFPFGNHRTKSPNLNFFSVLYC
jgi:hypothetical protein